MGHRRDYQAEYGYTPTWDLQREKQREHGVATDGHDGSPGECEDCGTRLVADSDRLICMNKECGKEYPFE